MWHNVDNPMKDFKPEDKGAEIGLPEILLADPKELLLVHLPSKQHPTQMHHFHQISFLNLPILDPEHTLPTPHLEPANLHKLLHQGRAVHMIGLGQRLIQLQYLLHGVLTARHELVQFGREDALLEDGVEQEADGFAGFADVGKVQRVQVL